MGRSVGVILSKAKFVFSAQIDLAEVKDEIIFSGERLIFRVLPCRGHRHEQLFGWVHIFQYDFRLSVQALCL